MNAPTALERFFLSIDDTAHGLWAPLLPLVKDSATFARLVVQGDAAPARFGQVVVKGGELRIAVDPHCPLAVGIEGGIRI
jgi:hypothetical protein